MTLNIRDLKINLIDSINPFEDAFQIVAKSIDKQTLGAIKEAIDRKMDRLPDFTENEVRIYWPQVQTFFEEYGRVPERVAEDPYESKLGEVLLYLRRLKEREAENGDK